MNSLFYHFYEDFLITIIIIIKIPLFFYFYYQYQKAVISFILMILKNPHVNYHIIIRFIYFFLINLIIIGFHQLFILLYIPVYLFLIANLNFHLNYFLIIINFIK